MIETIRRIEQKVLILLAQLKALRRENAALKQNILQFEQQNKVLNAELCTRKSEINDLKMLLAEKENNSEVTAQNHQIKQNIDKYISEIDECIEKLKHY